MTTRDLFDQMRKDGQGLSGFQEKIIQALEEALTMADISTVLDELKKNPLDRRSA